MPEITRPVPVRFSGVQRWQRRFGANLRWINCLFLNLIIPIHGEQRSFYTALLCLFFSPSGQKLRPGTAIRCRAPDERCSRKPAGELSQN